jgi:hypothetical protein
MAWKVSCSPLRLLARDSAIVPAEPSAWHRVLAMVRA